MQTRVDFRSSAFGRDEADDGDAINEGVWGKRLATYLVERLPSHGVLLHAPIAEDWGWYVPVEVDGVRLALCCGHQDGDGDELVIFTDPSTPVVRRGLRKVDLSEPLTKLVAALRAVLDADPQVHDVVWSDG